MSLLVWLPLNGNTNNRGFLYDGAMTTTSTAAYENSPFGTGLHLGTFIAYKNNLSFTLPTSFSIATWVKIDSFAGAWRRVFCINNANNNVLGVCNGDVSGTLGWHVRKADNSGYFIDQYAFNNKFSYGEWFHMGLVYDNTKARIYMNGALLGEYSVSNFVSPTYTKICLGSITDSYGDVNPCTLNDFRIYDHALSTKEVKELAKGLTIHYRLDGAGANPNLVPNSQIWNNSASCTTGLTRSTVNYDGYNIQRFTASQNITNSGVFTSCFSGNRWNGGKYTWSIEIRANRAYKIPRVGLERFTQIACDVSTEWKKFTATGTYAQSSYSAFVMYFDSTNPMASGDWFEVRNFKVEEGSIATSWIPNHYDGNYTLLGFGRKVLPYTVVGSPSNATGYFGSFSLANYLTTTTFGWNSWGDWEIYCKFTTGTDITTDQVITNCATGCSMDFGVGSSKFFLGLGNGSTWSIIDKVLCFTVEASKTYYVKIAFTGSAYTVSHSVTGFDSLTQDWSLTSSTKIATDGSARLIGNNRASGAPFLGYVDMEQFTVKTGGRTAWSGCTNYIYTPEPDCSGFGNNGTVTNRVYPAVGAPKGLSSTQFSGNGYIYTNNGFPTGTMPPFTINCWVNPQGGVNWYDYMCYRVVNYAGNTVDCRMEVSNNGANIGYYGTFPSVSTTTTKGQWYMMTFTHDGAGNLKAYKDGVQFASVTCTQEAHLNWSPNGYFRVGDGAIDFKGTDYRVYATCFSADDVKALYQTSASIDKTGKVYCYQMVEE